MHVLHVISGIDPKSGGPAAALAGLTKALVGKGVRVTVIATSPSEQEPPEAQRLRDHGVEVRVFGPARGPLGHHPEVRASMKSTLPSVHIVHIHALWEDVQHHAARIAFHANVPYIIRPCGMLDPWSLAQKRWKKRLYMAWRLKTNLNRAAAIHFTSNTERHLVVRMRLKPEPIIEPNGVELFEFSNLPPKGTFRHRYPQLADKPIVLFLSRLHAKKGLDLLIPAFAQAKTQGAMLVIAGPDDGGYLFKVKQLVNQHGLKDRTLFTGMLYGADRVAAYADADLFVLPSYQENFGIAVVEALAAGTPVIISDQVNIHDQITAANVGQVVPTRVDALASEITRWLADSPLRSAAAQRAQSFVWEQYDWRNIADRWVRHYQRLAQPR
jgi:glycosyltransferase involved in cell wall biosynthesis